MLRDVALGVRRLRYMVTGSTAEHLRLMTDARGPRRGEARFRAYTDWVVSFTCSRSIVSGRHRIDGLDVRVDATVTLPQWVAPAWASPGLIEAWSVYVAAVEEHEQGHVELAVRAAEGVRRALLALPTFETQEALAEAEERAAAIAVAAIRDLEREYDVATDHGATQGARLPQDR